MAFSIICTGIKSPEPNSVEDRDIVFFEVDYDSNKYIWMLYRKVDQDLGQFVLDAAPIIKAEIDYKEEVWKNLEPKTKQIFDPMSAQSTITVDILKEEVVRPEDPDYYALRRAAYPKLSDQIGALTNPNSTPNLTDIQSQVANVKLKYPKPAWLINI